MVSQHFWKLNVLLSLYAALIAIGLVILGGTVYTSPDVETAVLPTIQTLNVLIRANARTVTENTTLLQPYAQHTRIYSNITEINCSTKQHLRMKLLSLNCQSRNTAKDSLKSIVLNYNLDLVCLSETWEKDNKPLQFGSWPILSKPRINNSGHGGLAIICKPSDEFFITRRNDLEKPAVEAIFAEVTLKDKLKFLLAVAYIPQSESKQLKEFLDILKSVNHKHIIITGDLNAKSQEWQNSSLNESGKLLECFLHDSHFVCLNDGKPTRRSSDSVIDLFLTNPELVPKISLCETLTYENIQSDHLGVLLEIAKSSGPSSSEAEEKYIIGKTYWQL